MTTSGLNQRLEQTREILAGYVCVIPSAVSVQAMAAAGADWVVIDQEHGPIGPESMHAMIAATAGTRCAPLVRVPKADAAYVKLALDAGAEGILFPLVNTAEDAARCVSLISYPTQGRGGWGPFIGGVSVFDYLPKRSGENVCMLLIETRAAVENIEAICKVKGIDCIIVDAFDLSSDLGVSGLLNAPEMRDAIGRLEKVILEAGIPLGTYALSPEQTRALLDKGYRLLVHGVDVLMIAGLVRQTAEWR
jgi:4-hydroxy-2-oxoheptanedioate aldolase